MKFIETFDRLLEKSSSALLVVAVFSMLLLTVMSIVLRWFGVGLHWVDPLVRHLVFLSTFLGGVLATGKGTHIGIDILGKSLESKGEEKLLMVQKRVIMIATTFALAWLFKAGYDFALVEFEYGKNAFFGIHTGFLISIIPFGFGLMVLRFFSTFLLTFGGQRGNS